MIAHRSIGRQVPPARPAVDAGLWRGVRNGLPLSFALWAGLLLLVRWLLGG